MGLVYAVLGLFTLIFTFGAFISLPLDKAVDLGHTGVAGLDGTSKNSGFSRLAVVK